MLRFTRKTRQHIPNRLAIFASLMLLISSLAGASKSYPGNGTGANDIANNNLSTEQVADTAASNKGINRKKGFKVSLFLFRLD